MVVAVGETVPLATVVAKPVLADHVQEVAAGVQLAVRVDVSPTEIDSRDEVNVHVGVCA